MGQTDESKAPIIDMHLHAGWFGSGVKEALTGELAPKSRREYDEQTLLHLREHNITAVVSASLKDGERLRDQAPPGQIVLAVGFNNPKSISPEELRQLFKAKKIQAIAEVGTQYEGISPNDDILEPYFAMAEEEEIPIGIHMGPGPPNAPYSFFTRKYRAALSNPMLLEKVLVRHPKLRIWVMHAGWPMLDEMVNLLYSHPQVYVDTGVIDWVIPRSEFHHYLRRIVNAGFGKRVMFGSDQMTWPQAIPMAIDSIQSASFLSDEQKRDILYNNAATFMRWNLQPNKE